MADVVMVATLRGVCGGVGGAADMSDGVEMSSNCGTGRGAGCGAESGVAGGFSPSSSSFRSSSV